MAHNLNIENGRAAMYSLRESPWHKLGQVVDRPVTDPEVLNLAGLAWEVQKVGLWTETMDAVESHQAIRRADNGKVLGVVGAGYQLLQNAEMLSFFRDVAGARDMTVETAGALGQGETVWALARIPDLSLAIGQDRSDAYMLITTGHIGNRMLRIMPTTVRVVCQNTLSMATSGTHRNGVRGGSKEGGYIIRHTSGMKAAVAEITHAYKRAMVDFDAIREAMQALAAVRSTAGSLPAIVAETWPVKADADEGQRSATIRANREHAIARIRRGETCNVKGTEGTVWADLMAVTEYIDHDAGMKDAGRRFESSSFGGALEDQKGRALSAALALV